ncbi:hypothetical protein Tco_1485516 [Tanacetum coccineum]
MLSPAPPPSLIRLLGYRAAMIRLRSEAASTSHSLPLPPPFILSPTRSDAPSSEYFSLPISVLLHHHLAIPSCKFVGWTTEVGESSSAATARPSGGLRVDYGFVATMDREIRHDLKREVGYGITDSWDEIAWKRSMDASDLAYGEVMSLRTTILGQMSEIRELHAADAWDVQAVIRDCFEADHRRSA